MMSRSTLHRVAVLSAALVGAACGSGTLDVGFPSAPSNGGGGSSIGAATSYTGIVGDSLKHGSITVTVSSALTVTGFVTFAGSPAVPITGTVDTVAQEIHATGGGITIAAFTQNGSLSGAYGSGATSGFVVATSDSLTAQTHRNYCGAYVSTNSNGRFVIQVLSGGAAAGFAVQTSGTAQSSFFDATVINNTIVTGATDVGIPFNGTLSPDQSTITGTYAPPAANATGTSTATGTFTTTVGGC